MTKAKGWYIIRFWSFEFQAIIERLVKISWKAEFVVSEFAIISQIPNFQNLQSFNENCIPVGYIIIIAIRQNFQH